MDKESCPFCSEDTLRNQEVFRGKNILILLPKNPLSEGHFLIIPVRHEESLENLDSKELLEIKSLIKKIFITGKNTQNFEGYNVINNFGLCAGQHISHLHIHLILRSFNEDFSPLDVLSKKIEKKEMPREAWLKLRDRFRALFQ